METIVLKCFSKNLFKIFFGKKTEILFFGALEIPSEI